MPRLFTAPIGLTLVFALATAAGCDQGAADPRRAPATITLTSVTFADDCGGITPHAAAAPAAPAVMADEPADAPGVVAVERRCQQTSMQLMVDARSAAEVRVKSVEVFDEKGKRLGTLQARSPTRWSDADAMYQPWDQTVVAGQTARVSYVLQQPAFISRDEPRDRTYTVKVIASVGGVDQPLQTSVMVVAQSAPVPT